MIPVVIPSPGGDCFAMYQPAPGPAVLMCPPFGDEALKTARTWRGLALDLAQHGLAALRFDLPGTGNSAGDPDEPGRVAAWRGAVRACAAWLASRHDGRVILFGHRFGALLALDAASSGVAAERLVLLDPPASGAALVRYLRGRARLEGFGPPPEGPDFIQPGSVPLSASTLRDLQALPAPLADAGAAFPPALLVLNDSETSPSPWPARLRAAGSIVETAPFVGLDAFVQHDAFRAQPPLAVLDRVVDYLADAARETLGPAQGPRRIVLPPGPAALRLPGFTEQAITFGPAGGLFGILCQPDRPAPGQPALVLPTMGADPSSGLSRMWTELARRVARHGITSLRFDMTGVGESGGRLHGDLLIASYHPDRVADTRSAVDAMVARGFGRVILAGYCSGAYAAWHAALADPRIAAVLTGNLLYLNLQTMLDEDVLRSKPGSSRLGLEGGGMSRLLGQRSQLALRRLDDRARRLVPRRIRHLLRGWEADQKATRRHVRALLARGCAISMVMAHDDHGHIRLRRAFGETPRLPRGMELTVIPGADHMFSARIHRARFLDLAAAFALRDAAPASPAVPAPCLETTA